MWMQQQQPMVVAGLPSAALGVSVEEDRANRRELRRKGRRRTLLEEDESEERLSPRRALLDNETVRRRRLLEETTTSADASSDPQIANPVTCINIGDSILFDVSDDSYPEYQQASLLNTNPDFDYGAFRDLVDGLHIDRGLAAPGERVLVQRDGDSVHLDRLLDRPLDCMLDCLGGGGTT